MTTTEGGRAANERALHLAVPALGLVLAVVLLVASAHLTGPSGWYARVLVLLLAAVALVNTIVELRNAVRSRRGADAATVTGAGVSAPEPSEVDEPPAASRRGALLRVAVVVAAVVGMVLLADILGLWLAMLLPVLATLLVLGVRTWWKVVLAAGLTVAGGYVVFTILLQVRVPEGVLGLL